MERIITYKELAWPNLFFNIYRLKNRYSRNIIRKVLLRQKGADIYSKTLRKIYAKYHGVIVGMYSYGVFDPILPSGTVIGRYCSVAENLLVVNGSHPTARRSSHPFFYNPDLGYVDQLLIDRRSRLLIGNDVYIGLNVTIMPSVTNIGDGSVIAAGSVVVKDIPPFAIVGGNPAKIIRHRFNQQTIDEIMKSAWWDKDIEIIWKDETEFASFLRPLA